MSFHKTISNEYFKTNWEENFIHSGRIGQIKNLMWLKYEVLLVGGDILTFIML